MPYIALYLELSLQKVCFYGLFRSLPGTTENLYLAAGKPEVRTKLNLLQPVLIATLMYPLTMRYWGIVVAAIIPSMSILIFNFQ